MTKEIKGWHVASIFVVAFSIIISVNLVLAFNAIKTFPGLEVKIRMWPANPLTRTAANKWR